MGNMLQGLSTTIIGISIVMSILYLISVLLDFLRFIANKPPETADKAEEILPEENVSAEDEDEYETAAVITAALSAYLGTSGVEPSGLVIRSIRRVPAWNEATRKEQQRKLF